MRKFIHYIENEELFNKFRNLSLYYINLEKSNNKIFALGDASNPKKAITAAYIIDPSLNAKKDFLHHKNTGLTLQTLAEIKKKKTTLILPFDHIIKNKHPHKIIARFAAIVKLSRKYNISLIYAKKVEHKDDFFSISQFKDFERFFSFF